LGFAITDHDTFTKVNLPYPDIIAIPGMEISSFHGHILAIGINEQIPENLMANETVDMIHEQGALAIASHPFSSKENFPGLGDLVYELKLDGIEISNPKKHINNKLARRVAVSLNISKVGGSDAHDLESIGKGVTVLKENVYSTDDLINQIRKGKTNGLIRRN
jgi:predicted metal-dependent phosphoesterase TrpH